MLRTARLALLLLPLTWGCAGIRPDIDPPGPMDSDAGRVAMLYFPNRFMDLFDVARAGVELGPGIGADAMITDHLRAGAMKRWTMGLGLQTFRHTPFKDSTEDYAEFGPVGFDSGSSGLPWLIDPWDVRIELQVLIVGAHVAVNPAEIGDFIMGFALFDFREDDWE